MGKYLILVMLLFQGIRGFSQEKFRLFGKVTDTNQKPLETGDVVLLRPEDSSLIKVSKVLNGKFDFNLIEKGNYLLMVSCLGFQDEFRKINLNQDTDVDVTMKVNTSALKEVKVVSKTPIFTSKGGNIKMNVENTIFSEIPNIIDLISKLPSIQVSHDKQKITAVGRGKALVFIDNQRVSVNDLNSLSVQDIKNVEIINNPSAKYDAEGRVVISITRKVNSRQGFKADLLETLSFKRRYNNYAGINASLKKNKLEIKGDFKYNHLTTWESNSQDFRIDN